MVHLEGARVDLTETGYIKVSYNGYVTFLKLPKLEEADVFRSLKALGEAEMNELRSNGNKQGAKTMEQVMGVGNGKGG